MVKKVSFQEVISLLDEGAQLIEVLPRDEYDHLHMRGALSLPLKELNRYSAGELDPERPTIVYCNDSL